MKSLIISRRRSRREEGASLLIVLVLVTALSLVIGALLTGASTAQLSTRVSVDLKDAVYATDSGVEYGIEQVRAYGGFCPSVGGALEIKDGNVNASVKRVSSVTAAFGPGDVGVRITGFAFPGGTTIVGVGAGYADVADLPNVTTNGATLMINRPSKITPPNALSDGQNLSVTCSGSTSENTPLGLSGYAVVTLDPGPDSLVTKAGNGSEKQITGATFVSGGMSLVNTRFNESPPDPGSPSYPSGDGLGFVFQAEYRQVTDGATLAGTTKLMSATASFSPSDVGVTITGGPLPAGAKVASFTSPTEVQLTSTIGTAVTGITLKIYPPVACGPKPSGMITANFSCTSMPAPDPKPDLPTPAPTNDLGPSPAMTTTPPALGGGTCAIFLPGRYKSGLNLAGGNDDANYFASGIYYFEDLGRIDLVDHRVFGGAIDTASGDAQSLTEDPCSDDATAGVTSGDKGVQFILGGSSWLDVNKAETELMAFHPASTSSGPAGVSVRTVPKSHPANYKESTVGGADNKGLALRVATGNNPHFSVHGLVYAPNASVELNSTNTAAAEILGGVLAWNVSLEASASASGLLIQVTGGPSKARSKIIIEGSVPVSASKTVKSRAVVDVNVDPAPRTVADGATTGTKVVTSATAKFKASDVGSTISGLSIPTGSYITAVTNATTVVISDTTGTQANITLTIDPSTRTLVDGVAKTNDTHITSATASFTAADIGAAIKSIAADGTLTTTIQPATTIVSIIGPNEAVLSLPATKNSTEIISIFHKRVAVTVQSWRVENP